MVRVGRRPVDEKIRGRIQQEDAGRGWGCKEGVGRLEAKWGVRAHQTQEMKGKEGSGDPEGQETKSGLPSSGRGLDTSGEKGFFADVRSRGGVTCGWAVG